jgi:hypothetical protein
MQSARMSVASMASTMGWSERRVQSRLDALNSPALPEDPAIPVAASAEEAADEDFDPIEAVDLTTLAEGEGVAVRSFSLEAGGFGASIKLRDGRTVFTVTGGHQVARGQRIKVRQAGNVWTMEGQADA